MKKPAVFLLLTVPLVFSGVTAQQDTCTNRITSLTNNDEDSWIMKASDGTYYLPYFSDSTGSPDIWITRSPDGGASWDTTWLAIQSADSNWYPCMAQDNSNVFHMVWFRLEVPSGNVNIWYSRSTDAMNWSAPVPLTNTNFIDWTPNLVIDFNGILWVTWASNRTGNQELFLIRSTDGGNTWSNPIQITNHPSHDNMPFMFQRSDSTFILVWQRYPGPEFPYLNNNCEIYYSTSPDGMAWSNPDSITYDTGPNYADVVPAIYTDGLTGEIYFTWTSNRFSPGNNLELRLSAILGGALGNQAIEITCNGYYARGIPSDTLGQVLLVWVADPDNNGQRDIYSRYLNKATVSVPSPDEGPYRYKIFPNPFSASSTFEMKVPYTLGGAVFEMSDIYGRKLRSYKVSNSSFQIERGTLKSGVYFYQLSNGKEILAKGKIIIE
jgi:hypothetical protein